VISSFFDLNFDLVHHCSGHLIWLIIGHLRRRSYSLVVLRWLSLFLWRRATLKSCLLLAIYRLLCILIYKYTGTYGYMCVCLCTFFLNLFKYPLFFPSVPHCVCWLSCMSFIVLKLSCAILYLGNPYLMERRLRVEYRILPNHHFLLHYFRNGNLILTIIRQECVRKTHLLFTTWG
jgi:hypothetical protein